MVAKALIAVAPKSVILEVLEFAQLPLYNQHLDEKPLKEWTDYLQRLKSFDGIIFVIPDPNSKPGAVISFSVGVLDGFGTNHQLRHSLVFLNTPKMPQPVSFLGGNAAQLFEASGQLNDQFSRSFLTKFMSSFVAKAEKYTSRSSMN